jgi:hypothetical protein
VTALANSIDGVTNVNFEWYEVWVSDSPTLPYVLIVIPDEEGAGGVMVIDPQEDQKVVYRATEYENAKLWLLEDEFRLARGRMTV